MSERTGKTRFDDRTRKTSRETAVSKSDTPAHKRSAESSVKSKEEEPSSIYKSSDEFFEYTCDPCSSAGEKSEADGYCIDCGEYLCGTCFKSHSRGKATLSHRLMDKDTMPKKSNKICDPCKAAGEDKDAVGYCDDCEEYLCDNCFRSHSRSKATKRHNLTDKDNMPHEADKIIAKMDIKEDRDFQKKTEEYTHIRDINVKAKGDKENCYIIAMTLMSNSDLVLADYHNKSVKLVDTKRNMIKSTLDLQSDPFGLATISKDQVAVTLPNVYQIQIITVDRNLSVQRTIKLMGQCLDIIHLDGKFYVSFTKPVQFQILQPSGSVHKTISPDSDVIKHCPFPRHIAVSPDETVIYVSDWENNKVMSIDMNGNMKCMYQGELDLPKDIVLSPTGSVYLCNRLKHVVNRMRRDLSEPIVILGPGDGLSFPQAVCFNTDKQHLYVSSGSSAAEFCNFLKVFKWK